MTHNFGLCTVPYGMPSSEICQTNLEYSTGDTVVGAADAQS